MEAPTYRGGSPGMEAPTYRGGSPGMEAQAMGGIPPELMKMVGDAIASGRETAGQVPGMVGDAMADAQPMMREGMARMGMPNPAQSITDAALNAKEAMGQGMDAGREMMGQVPGMVGDAMSAGQEMAGQGMDAAAPYVEQGQEMGSEAVSALQRMLLEILPEPSPPPPGARALEGLLDVKKTRDYWRQPAFKPQGGQGGPPVSGNPHMP